MEKGRDFRWMYCGCFKFTSLESLKEWQIRKGAMCYDMFKGTGIDDKTQNEFYRIAEGGCIVF